MGLRPAGLRLTLWKVGEKFSRLLAGQDRSMGSEVDDSEPGNRVLDDHRVVPRAPARRRFNGINPGDWLAGLFS